ncbi:MAG: sulfatase [Carboxylicivirga sp.]|jgi:arylsulfatase A-like enzyme|nr:sulfatase [Carboxylicivirga sp.]
MKDVKIVKCLLILVIYLFAQVSIGQNTNVLLIFSDDLNTSIGPYMQIKEHTPNLDRLAEEGVRFTQAYCQFPLCGPSRASIMSGLYPETNGVIHNSDRLGSYKAETPSLLNHPSLAGFFRENGYFTARVSKIFHMGVPGGIERGESGGDDPSSWDYAYNVMGPETLSDGELELLSPGNLHYVSNFSRMKIADTLDYTQTDYLATSQAIAILESRAAALAKGATNKKRLKEQVPFFLAVGLVRPHVPLIAPENCFKHYPDADISLPNVEIGDNVPEKALRKRNGNKQKMDQEQMKHAISGYMASVRFMDQQVGRLLNALDRLDLRKETIVVFLSDHGYNLGEHDCWSKGSLWEGTLRVPLIISDPVNRQQNGAATTTVCELIDLYPTLLDLCDMTERQPRILQGRSLAPALRGNSLVEKVAYSITYSGKEASVRTDRWRYTRWGESVEEGNEELYDHLNDPEELENLATKQSMRKVLVKMRSELDKARTKARH